MTFKGTPQNPRPVMRSEKVANNKIKRWFKGSLYFVISMFILTSIYSGYEFVQTHDFESPIIIKFQNPTPRKAVNLISPVGSRSASLIKKAYAADRKLTDEEYIREKFGKQGNIAVAIAKAESGLNPKKVNSHNTDGSVDFGCWQINSVHLDKAENAVVAAELLATFMDCRKATDWVYENLYLASGFNPWVAYTTGSYLNKL